MMFDLFRLLRRDHVSIASANDENAEAAQQMEVAKDAAAKEDAITVVELRRAREKHRDAVLDVMSEAVAELRREKNW